MAILLRADGSFEMDPPAGIALVCPHCGVHAHQTPVSIPAYSAVAALRPIEAGLVCHCDACASPVFLRFAVEHIGADAVYLAEQCAPVERPRESIDPQFLPAHVVRLVDEALAVHGAGYRAAFGLLVRQVVEDVVTDLGEHGRLRLYELLNDFFDLVEVDADTASSLRRLLVGRTGGASHPLPELSETAARVLLVVLRDLLYQCYVRRGRLREALGASAVVSDDIPTLASASVTPLRPLTGS